MIKKITLFVFAIFLSLVVLHAQEWTQIGSDIDGEAADDWSGQSVSLSADGSVLAIGADWNNGNGNASGHVRVYENQNGAWVQVGQDIDGEAPGDQSGNSVSLNADGSILAVGAPYNSASGPEAGHVRVYENQNGTWVQKGHDIDGESSFNLFGFSVSLSADGLTLASGAINNDGNGSNSGNVRIYEYQDGTWVQVGQDIDGEAPGDQSGRSVSLSADASAVAIGAPYNNGNGTYSGHVRIYKNQSGTWVQTGQDIDGEAENDDSGWSVSLNADGTVVAIGAFLNDGNGSNSGHVRIYEYQDGTWVQTGQDIDGEASGDQSGSSVSLSADASTVAIGACLNSGSNPDAGHVRIYKNQSGTWLQTGPDIDGEAQGDQSGKSVTLSADASTVAIGAIYNDGSASNAGHVRVFKFIALPLITSQPEDLENICLGADASYTVVGEYIDSYQWQISTDGGNSYSDIANGEIYSGVASETLNLSGVTVVMNNNLYRCVLTNIDGTLLSNAAVLMIDDEKPQISCIENQTVYADNSHFFTVQGTEFDPAGSSDNCGVNSLINNFNSASSLAGVQFPEGTTNVVWTVTDDAGNSEECSFDIIVNAYTVIVTLQQSGISIYPNPVRSILTLYSEQQRIKKIKISDMKGKIVKQFLFHANNSGIEIDLSDLEKGIYFIGIQTENELITSKILKD